jgi:hypothetical protein
MRFHIACLLEFHLRVSPSVRPARLWHLGADTMTATSEMGGRDLRQGTAAFGYLLYKQENPFIWSTTKKLG